MEESLVSTTNSATMYEALGNCRSTAAWVQANGMATFLVNILYRDQQRTSK